VTHARTPATDHRAIPIGDRWTVIEAVRALAPDVRAQSERIERDRRLPLDLVRSLARIGVFRLCVPRALGGAEAEPATLLAVLEELSRADGSTGWCAMIGATSGLLSAYLPESEARAIYGASPDVISGGVFAPTASATLRDGQYRVSGRWRFASGCQHCDWLMGGCVVQDDGPPRARMVLFPAADAEIIDTWTVSGLRGTGSHDIAVRDLLVPATRSASLTHDRPVASGALYAFPLFGLLAIGVAAVALGIARRALDEIVALAVAKTPTAARRTLAERSTIQAAIAEAEATLAAARAFLHEVVGTAWQAARDRGAIDVPLRARLRLAATHATAAAARATDAAYTAGGGTAVYADSPLQRTFRDVHVVTQHMMVAPATWELAGRVLLGLETDTTML
jgi:alkylation response protein AidB-like acyl-CoA dehydrogenase